MKVLLLVEIPKVGHKGEIVDVSEGYAKNLLLRKKMAVVVTSQIISEYERKKFKETQVKENKIKEIKSLAEKLNGQLFQFHVKIGKHNEVFSSVHAQEITKNILEYLKKQGGQNLDIEDIELEIKPIKELGRKKISVKLGKGEYSKTVQIEVETMPREGAI